ncbi:MAG TPA: vitamin K epoxide reductase family protein [Candidatus Paceibacterota bacterium]|nr:vitamin K epoxide reductase family protein [Verrucomicrobiota bacterium]HRY51052.1 vitamin K epoxide reductase family protein [Candidatus Paceibacterota bacterium]HRZ99449.1 vitamin K epoxide reductase family protein [Candidatus Paceibacterota bacterium]
MSSHPKRPKKSRLAAPRWLWPIRFLLGIAALVDAYLLWSSGFGGALAGCGPESECHVVLNSRWAYWFGIPVSVPALGVYLFLITGTRWLEPNPPGASRGPVWRLLFAGSVAVLAAGLWFVGLQLFVLKAICVYCMGAHACGMAAAALILLKAKRFMRNPGKGRTHELPPFRPGDMLLPTAGAVGVVLVLVVGQALHQPKTYQSTLITAGISAGSATMPARKIRIYDGECEFQLNEVPLMGKPDAEHVLVSLFDYTCYHCRQVHPILVEASRQFSNQLAIVNLPMPLDSRCNPIVRRTQPAHTNACALARLGLTVWAADRKKSAVYDHWVFTPTNPPLPAEAESYARKLVGSEAFDKAFTNAWVETQLQRDMAVYEASRRRFRKGVMPQLIVGTNLISGVYTRSQFYGMLAKQFGLTSAIPQRVEQRLGSAQK